MASAAQKLAFQFVSGQLCLDFVNTQLADDGRPLDLLEGFGDLVAWCAAAGIVTRQRSEALLKAWEGTPEAERAFGLAMRLRAGLRAIAEQSVLGEGIPQRSVAMVNEALREWRGHYEVVPSDGGYAKRFCPRLEEPADLLPPIADSAAELMSAGDLGQIKQCSSPACVLYYYDTTKNHTRRWCSMSTCGNRAKVGAYYQRKQQVAG